MLYNIERYIYNNLTCLLLKLEGKRKKGLSFTFPIIVSQRHKVLQDVYVLFESPCDFKTTMNFAGYDEV